MDRTYRWLKEKREKDPEFRAAWASRHYPRMQRWESAKLRSDPDFAAKRRAQKKRSMRRAALKKYGLTLEQYEAMLASQGGTCAVCGGGPGYNRDYNIDHCHKTGRVRGILCISCNVILGHAKDDPARLDLLAAYLRKA